VATPGTMRRFTDGRRLGSLCPDCGNSDGAKVERIAFHPTFRCECGYVWDGSHATFVGLWNVDGDATDAEIEALADVIVEAMREVARDAD
jgi:hypothetical protein